MTGISGDEDYKDWNTKICRNNRHICILRITTCRNCISKWQPARINWPRCKWFHSADLHLNSYRCLTLLIIFYWQAFQETKITKIEIPRSVKKIDTFAFSRSFALEEIVFQDGSQLETIGAGVSDFIPLFFIISFDETYLFIYLFHFLFLGFRKHPIKNY